ncbi:MAG: peptidylprolyl isomerase [Elusimicrobia bacterium GWC2_51_8]|nr:MAG: peptidylprolyl isomerase [Elusimicrobia bacterium GWA2_51_34]OGR59662.1 MAG: peptidylprolyl isomerase [Elusimicrobia bacterium GWC2_51_8]OGR87497.1 MAG: peptidylprolyl isomerase [Elusimicrobia bacterium GWF2_52_66]HAF95988.1 peptidylprolyl isomerase [Elusimicrobiota bacterium]HCE97015.1 peptidylprolyl isomerase [Elusimicrobiota bacterium]
MKLAVAILFSALTVGTAAAQDAAIPSTEEQKVLYALGVALGRNIAPFSLVADDVKYVAAGLNDAVKGNKLLVDFDAYSPKIGTFAQSRMAAKADVEKQRSKPFIEKSAKQKGAVTTSSGLIYSELKKGKGVSPKASDTVKVHYHGTLIDGTVFDSSVARKTPATFPLSGVIACWTEGVQKMKVGGKSKLICPSAIAYGDQGRPPQIPGGAVLVFEIELLGIETPAAAAPAKK